MDDIASDPSAVRALASAVIQHAVAGALSDPRTDAGRREREAAIAFLCDPADPRLERWTAPLGLDADALRSRLRRRLAWQPQGAEKGAA